MKKIVVLLCFGLLLCGCGKEKKEDVVKDFQNMVNNTKSYKISGNMEISNDEETFTYSLESYYLKDEFYKVVLVNQTNNHEQIILKNKEDIYVITPALNKSFKFQSEWPGNSSQAYLLGSILKDIEKDAKKEVVENDKGYVIKTAVNYPNNNELKYQKIYLNNKKVIEKVEVYNENDIVKIKVVFEKVDLKAGLKDSDFKLEDYVKEENNTDVVEPDKENNAETNNQDENNTNVNSKPEDNNCENSEDANCQNNNNNNNSNNSNNEENKPSNDNSSKTGTIENIIYPLYIPSNTFLTSSETVETGNGNRVILTFSGEKNFVLIEEAAIAPASMEIIPVYGEPLLLSETIGALSANSLSWDVGDVSYYLASTELSVHEMQSIANSLGNTTLVANTK